MQQRKLERVIEMVRALPSESQDLLLSEIENRIAELSTTEMTTTQRNTVRARMGAPRQHVSDEDVRALLRRYDPDL